MIHDDEEYDEPAQTPEEQEAIHRRGYEREEAKMMGVVADALEWATRKPEMIWLKAWQPCYRCGQQTGAAEVIGGVPRPICGRCKMDDIEAELAQGH